MFKLEASYPKHIGVTKYKPPIPHGCDSTTRCRGDTGDKGTDGSYDERS